jgi:hypothetical protein
VRQDNLASTRTCPAGCGAKGWAFFAEEEDEFGLGDAVAALLFHEEGGWCCMLFIVVVG